MAAARPVRAGEPDAGKDDRVQGEGARQPEADADDARWYPAGQPALPELVQSPRHLLAARPGSVATREQQVPHRERGLGRPQLRVPRRVSRQRVREGEAGLGAGQPQIWHGVPQWPRLLGARQLRRTVLPVPARLGRRRLLSAQPGQPASSGAHARRPAAQRVPVWGQADRNLYLPAAHGDEPRARVPAGHASAGAVLRQPHVPATAPARSRLHRGGSGAGGEAGRVGLQAGGSRVVARREGWWHLP